MFVLLEAVILPRCLATTTTKVTARSVGVASIADCLSEKGQRGLARSKARSMNQIQALSHSYDYGVKACSSKFWAFLWLTKKCKAWVPRTVIENSRKYAEAERRVGDPRNQRTQIARFRVTN